MLDQLPQLVRDWKRHICCFVDSPIETMIVENPFCPLYPLDNCNFGAPGAFVRFYAMKFHFDVTKRGSPVYPCLKCLLIPVENAYYQRCLNGLPGSSLEVGWFRRLLRQESVLLRLLKTPGSSLRDLAERSSLLSLRLLFDGLLSVASFRCVVLLDENLSLDCSASFRLIFLLGGAKSFDWLLADRDWAGIELSGSEVWLVADIKRSAMVVAVFVVCLSDCWAVKWWGVGIKDGGSMMLATFTILASALDNPTNKVMWDVMQKRTRLCRFISIIVSNIRGDRTIQLFSHAAFLISRHLNNYKEWWLR